MRAHLPPPLSPQPTPSAESSGPIFNASILIGPDGETVHHYRKTHLFGSYELDIFTPGGVGEISTSLLRPSNIRVGILICMDCEYPEPSRLLGTCLYSCDSTEHSDELLYYEYRIK